MPAFALRATVARPAIALRATTGRPVATCGGGSQMRAVIVIAAAHSVRTSKTRLSVNCCAMRMHTVVATLVAVLISTAASHAQGHGVRVLISNGFKAVFDDLVPACEKSIGQKVTTQSGTSTSLIEKVNAGEAFDVAIMTTEAMETLGKAGKVATRTPLGRSGIGIGSRAGAKKPDIGNAEALKKTFTRQRVTARVSRPRTPSR